MAAGSRELRRELGPVAWAALADVIEDAAPDGAGRVVAVTSARRLAANLGVSKDTAARALGRLIGAGLLERVAVGRVGRGRFGTASYLVCVPQPTADPPPASTPTRPSAPPADPKPSVGCGHQAVAAQASLFDAP